MRHGRLAILLAILSGTASIGTPASAADFSIFAGSHEEIVPPETRSSWASVETRLLPISDTRSEIEDIRSCPFRLFFCDVAFSRVSRETTAIEISEILDENAVENYVSTLASKLNRDPKDAKFGENESHTEIRVVEPSVSGIRLDEAGAAAMLKEALENGMPSVILPTRLIPPAVSDNLDKVGIREVVGEGKTNFSGSPKNRIFNIRRALEQFQGLIIQPSEEFSFVKYLGEVDGEHGYLPELVIKYNKTEPEFGGGICQVSSTVFRAAIDAGMKITARRNHAYPVRYYKPYGMDATIYIPNPDFRFINNTGNPILIQSSIEGTELSFRFYGTKDGRTVAIDGPHILESNPDGSMKTTFSQTVTDVSGNVVIHDSFPSNYKSPSLYPHPEEFTVKPDDWSKKQWEAYLAAKSGTSTTN